MSPHNEESFVEQKLCSNTVVAVGHCLSCINKI